MNTRGFTFVEIIVTMAVLSILIGIIVPISYRAWEAGEIRLTRERMADLKKAMIGDPALVQQGIRVGYGFVGDNGELPAGLDDLVANQGVYANWNGPYLVAGSDPREFAEDAWGEPLIYTPASDPFGRLVAATLVSKGPDRLAGTADDLDAASAPTEQLVAREVAPTNVIRGNFGYAVSVADADETPTFYAALTAQYQDAGGTSTMAMSNCVRIDVGLVQKLVPRSGSVQYTGIFPINVPIGKVVVAGRLFPDNTCSGAPLAETGGSLLFVNPGQHEIFYNPPTLYHHIDNGP
jgi:prepilin-type N-terminal cleavage/methylation domain-containing protein